MAFWRKEEKAGSSGDPQAHVARREYDKAIKAYRSLLASEPEKYIYSHKIADVYCLAGRQEEAMDDYARAADGYARDGFLIKATAILKKMQRIRPGDPEVERRLAELGKTGSSSSSPAPAAGDGGFAGGPELSFDMEAVEDERAVEAPATEEPAAIPVAGQEGPAVPVTPLFSDFTPEELSDVLSRLKHQSYDAGAVIVKEGDPGESLFVLSQGRVRVVGTGPGGKAIELAELNEGDFFGEVALLTGKPRTATITCIEETEVLELSRGDLEELEGRHARVRQVIQEFYERRVESTVESMLDAVRLPDLD
jgi:hypothetical protein